MKSKLILLLLLLSFAKSQAQTVIFSENMGTPSGTTTIANNTFQNGSPLVYSNLVAATPTDVRITNASSNYIGASGAGNIFFSSSSSGSYGFSIEGINASNFTSLSLQFGYRKESASVLPTFSVEYWNGNSWVVITDPLFSQLSNASAIWYLSNSISLPAAAQINNLGLRFIKTGSTAIRIDDVKLTGTLIVPTITNTTITNVTSNSATFTGNVTATGGIAITATGTVYAKTAINATPTIGGMGVTTLSIPSPNNGTGTFSNNSGAILLPNVQYSYNAYATNSASGTGYGTVASFYTLAAIPSAPFVSSPTATSLNISIGTGDTNSSVTTYSIFESNTSKYLQANGSLGTSPVYQTASIWGNTTVTGLTPSSTYSFQVVAKNADGVITLASDSSTSTTLPAPSITTSGTLSALNAPYGTASSASSFSVSGANLIDNIIVTPPAGFEISQTVGGTSGYASSQTVTPTSGTVPSTTLYIRLAATTGAGTYSGNITFSSANVSPTVTLATISSSVTKLDATITEVTASNKVCDGTTAATLTGTPILNGILSSDNSSVIVNTGAVTANFADAIVGNTKAVTVSGYTLSGSASANYNLIQPSGLTANITANTSSDIVFNSSSTTSDNININYKNYQATTIESANGTNGSVGVMGFYLRDGGAIDDADNLNTELTAITFNVTNATNIRSARLFVGTSPRGTSVNVNGSSVIEFTGLTNIIATDNNKLAINLRVTFNTSVTDNQQMQFTIASATTNTTSSQFTSPNGGGASSSIAGDINRIEVTADRLAFVQQPPASVFAENDMNPSPSVDARDSNGNRDLDFSASVSITSSGTLSNPQTVIATSGLATFNSISHAVAGSGIILTASASGLSTVNSNTFTVNPLIVPTFDAIAPVYYGSTLTPLPTTSINNIVGSWSPELDNTQTTTYTFTPSAGQNANSTTLTITIIPAYTVILTSAIGTNNQSACINTPLTNITYATTGATNATVTGLPTGISDSFSSNTLIISGTANQTGIFHYTVTLIGSYGTISTTGTITIQQNSSILLSSESDTNYQALDINTPLTNIVYNTFNTNTVTVTGLPNGVTGVNSNGMVTISGSPTVLGTFPYTVNASGNCLTTYETGIITVNSTGSTATNGSTGSNGTSGNNGNSQSQNFADTKGELQISSSGTATYTLPIATPPSLKNVAPVINLTYSSGVRGGIAGQGWNINSISTISRMGTRRDIDGFVDGVDFDDNDKLSLDGQRLIRKTGAYWVNGSTYETEYKSNTKIELKIENGGNTTFFIVTSPDGSRTWYGSKGEGSYQNATSANAWYIVRFEDTNGNNIVYNYSNVSYNNTNQLYIKSIAFSANQTAGVAPQNKIVFNYRNAKRIERDYIKGAPVYATKILDNIQVFANDALFRRYQLTQTADTNLGYERVTKVQEFNGSDEPSNPVFFEYETTPQTTNRIEKHYDNNLNFSDVDVAGDFDGDGRLDFVVDDKLFTNLFTGDSGNAPIANVPVYSHYTATTLTDNKLNQFQSLVNISNTDTNTEFKIYNLEGNQFVYKYSKNIALNRNTVNTFESSTGSTYGIMCAGYFHDLLSGNTQNTQVTYNEGDFNGDGISEFLIKITKTDNHFVNEESYPNPIPNPFDPDQCNIINNPVTTTKHYLVDLNNTNTSYGIVELTSNSPTALEGTKYFSDFNGDGKTDILVIDYDGIGKVYSYEPYSNSYYNLKYLGAGDLTDYAPSKQMLFGDYNGDGKTDIMLPVSSGCSGCSDWNIYYSNPKPQGGDFFVKESHNIVEYWPNTGSTYKTQTHFSNYYAIDVNGDGKSDLVRVWRKYYKPEWTINDHDTSWSVAAYTNNIGKVGASGFQFTYHSGEFDSKSPDIPIPITSNYRYHGANTDLVIVRGHYNRIEYYQFNKDLDTDNRLKSVTESNANITQTIEYKPMVATNFGLGDAATDFYSSNNDATYPNIEIIRNTGSYLVSKLTATINGVSKSQDFKYRSYISNFNYGTVGFAKTSRSSWYLNESDTKIWTTQYNDTSLRGANTITWSSTNAATVFATIPDNLLSTKTNIFQTYTNPTTKVYNVLLHQQTTEDALTGVKSENTFTYDGNVDSSNYFGLQTGSVAKQYSGATLQGTTTTVNEYESNAGGIGANYYIGRPTKVNTTTAIYTGDTRTSEEKYTYTGSQLTKTEKKGHNTDYAIVEDMTYDTVGNLLTKTVSAPLATVPVASRTITDEYGEPTKRFVTKKTDHQGFVTLFEYNTLGQLKESTNYLGVVSEYSYDNWGKLTKTTTTNASDTPLVTTIGYTKLADGGYTTTSWNVTGDNAKTITQYDVQGRVVKTTTKGFALNTLIAKEVVYDGLGRKLKESEPYSTTASRWTTYEYDYLQRPTKVTAPTGRVQTLAYSGLTTTSIDDGKTTTATVDALGNKIQTTDPGGTINFTYYANGQLKESDYEGHKVTIGIDGWGNKTSTFDPNAGNYTYAYDAFGQIKTETTPKGTTTMTYDDFGKLIKKKILGDGADFETDYAYNSFGQLLSETSKKAIGTPIDTFTYTYDALHRPSSTTESNSKFIQSQTITYDTYGRAKMATNTTQELLTGLSSTVVSINNYNTYNGIMDKITDDNNQLLWKLTAANEKMQSVSEEMGNGSSIMNYYDSNNYFSSQKHYSVNLDDIVDNVYDFNGSKGTLNNRQNVVLGVNEIFTYDALDRLTHWTNPLTNTIDSNEYDNRGRITTNNKIGDVNYNNTPENGMYRKTSVVLNPAGLTYYTNLPNQTVTYTMFKSPITINESEKGATTFVYNSHLSRQSMQYGYMPPTPGATPEYTKTKLYTDDGSTEILQSATSVTIRTYIGGDAYSAPLYQQTTKNLETGVEVTKKYYLHRDYLGSIIAIVDEDGVVVERRQFDAWGNLAKLEQNGVLVTPDVGAMLLDRGYTSHEHLAEVGLIHMNGRLYDPVLRSFLMPDNFIQQPENTQNYNRYAYGLNNPLMYTDPSGEFIPFLAAVAIGAAIGALTYTMTALLADVPFTVGGLLKSTFIGAATAAVTFGVGCAASSMFSTPAVGFLQGAYQGAVIGAITGVGGVVANAIFTGQNITLKAVLGGAITGAVIGGAIGGIQGGLNAQEKGLSFWKGVGSSTSDIAMPPVAPLSNEQYANNTEMRADYDTNIGRVDGMNLADAEDKVGTSVFLGNDNNLATGYKMDSNGFITNSNGQNVPGYTNHLKSEIFGKLYSQTTIAPSLKGYSVVIKNMIFKHEFMHAWHWSSGFNNFNTYSERATSQFSKVYSKTFNFDYTMQEIGSFPSNYGWQNFNKIIKTWIK